MYTYSMKALALIYIYIYIYIPPTHPAAHAIPPPPMPQAYSCDACLGTELLLGYLREKSCIDDAEILIRGVCVACKTLSSFSPHCLMLYRKCESVCTARTNTHPGNVCLKNILMVKKHSVIKSSVRSMKDSAT